MNIYKLEVFFESKNDPYVIALTEKDLLFLKRCIKENKIFYIEYDEGLYGINLQNSLYFTISEKSNI